VIGRSAALGVALLAALLHALPASAQTRDARTVARGTAVISGTVVSDEAEPRPVRRVRVTCTGAELGGAMAVTDDRGRFVFPGLRAGRYTIAATKEAWVATAYGAKRPLRPGSAIPLADGQKMEVVLKLLRGSVITGIVLDHTNQPAANTVVNAMRYVMQSGERRLSSSGTGGLTDDRGVYRIYGLAPGDYVVGAAARGPALNAPSSELRLIGERNGGERTVSFASTFYPGTAIATQAAVVTLGRAEERSGVDFALQLIPTARVEGTVTLPDGAAAPAGTQVNLLAGTQVGFPGSPLAGFRTARVGADGAFSFTDVSPGTYTVLARATVPAHEPGAAPRITWASSEIAVDGERITGLSLGLQPGMTVAGHVRFEGTRLKPPADLQSVRVTLQPVQAEGTVSFAPGANGLDSEGRFVVSGVTPGRYRLGASFPGSGRPGNWQQRSAIMNGQDTLDVPFMVQPSQSISGAAITFTERLAQLTGTVQNATGGAPNEFTVIVFSVDQSHWQPRARRIQGVRPSADGAYTFSGLPAGDYYLAAIDDVEPGEWFDPAFLQRLLPAAMKLSIADAEQKVQDIRLGGAVSMNLAAPSATSIVLHLIRR
jgi:uncharacterized protein (DUF2141 family)